MEMYCRYEEGAQTPILSRSFTSPEVSGMCGVAFLRLICQEMKNMQGEVQINDWRVALDGSGFDPKLGIGCVFIGSYGIPVSLFWTHVDGIFLHGTTHAKCTSALKNILDLKVLVGLICHSTKLKYRNFVGFCMTPR
jgi:hypothetical protein